MIMICVFETERDDPGLDELRYDIEVAALARGVRVLAAHRASVPVDSDRI